MPNQKLEIVNLLQDALADLQAVRQELVAVTNMSVPQTRNEKLAAALTRYREARTALNKAKFLNNNGEGLINSKLTFDFYETVAKTDADENLLVEKLQPLAVGAFEQFAAVFQTNFPQQASAWRGFVVAEINAILNTHLGTGVINWAARSDAAILFIRAELDNCLSDVNIVSCIEQLNLPEIRTRLINLITSVVGADFNASTLNLQALVDRNRKLPTIVNLRDNYGVTLAGAAAVSIGVWLSSTTATLSLIDTILQAVQATAQTLRDQIIGWDDPNIGYLRGISNISIYLQDLKNAASAAGAFKRVADSSLPLTVTLAPTAYTVDPLKLFGYLNGWAYARFAKSVIQIDRDIYQAVFQANVASRLWNSQAWSPTSNAILRSQWSNVPGFTNRGITSIDPVHSLVVDSLYDFIVEYRSRTTVCTPEQSSQLCHENCYEPAVKNLTENVTDWAWAGTPRTSIYLPFLPSSILTGCVPARKSLARGTRAFWNEIGIFGDIEYLVRWVNALEHGTIVESIGDEDIADQVASDLMEFLHFIYRSTTPNDRDIEYLAAQSSAILEYDNNRGVDERTYIYFDQLLTPVEELPTGETFANVAVDLDWSITDSNQYSNRIRDATANGAVRTFGSTEFDVLTVENRHLFVAQQLTSNSSWVAFISVDNTWPTNGYSPTDPDPKAPIGVFLLTAAQFNFVQGLE